MESGGRVSYKPYRDASKVLIHRLRQFAGVGVIEKASIDEAYILYKVQPQHQQHGVTNMQQATQLANNIRHAGIIINKPGPALCQHNYSNGNMSTGSFFVGY